MKRLRRSALALFGVTALAAVSLAVIPRLFGRKRLRFTYLTGQLAPSEYRALASEPGWSAAQLTVAPGIKLRGLVRRPSSADAPWVLYYPGNDATQLKRGQAFLSNLGADRDWGLAVFAYRGYDSSDGVPHVEELAADSAEMLVQLCETEKISLRQINVVGFSIGGYFAVRAVGAVTERKQPPASLSLLASVDDVVMVRRSPWAKLDPGDDLQTRPFLGPIRAPVLVVQGGADQTLGGPVQGQALAKALGGRARYLELPGVGHNVLIETSAAVAAVRSFIDERAR